jgi:hypothetical protein
LTYWGAAGPREYLMSLLERDLLVSPLQIELFGWHTVTEPPFMATPPALCPVFKFFPTTNPNRFFLDAIISFTFFSFFRSTYSGSA